MTSSKKPFTKFLCGALAFCFLGVSPAFAGAGGEFYVAVLKSITGLDGRGDPSMRPLIDRRATAHVSEEAHQSLVNHFAKRVQEKYGQSVVNINQLADSFKGPIRFVDGDKLECGQVPTVSLKQAYVFAIGVSRASQYEVERGSVEVLIPYTLNLQVIKPDSGKIVFATSKTVYSYFPGFSRKEMESGAASPKIAAGVADTLRDQIDTLVGELSKGFNPSVTKVKIVAKEGDLLVADKGFEVGFKDGGAGDLLEAIDASGKPVLFTVISVGDGYAVLRVAQGAAKEGAEYQFIFDSKADDSRKPKLLPVGTHDPTRADLNGVMENFSKSVGFQAAFQISPVDVTFAETMSMLKRDAACVTWGNFPGASTGESSRSNPPQYLLLGKIGETKTQKQASSGDVKTKETFGTVVQFSVVDSVGNVLGSSIGSDTYVLEKTAGMGLLNESAREISFRNSVTAATKYFLENVKLAPKQFLVKAVEKGQIIVDGVPAADGTQLVGSIQRSLKTRVNGKEVLVKLPTEVSGPLASSKVGQSLPFSSGDVLDPTLVPKPGDSLVIFAMPKAGAVPMNICQDDYIGKNNTVISSFSTAYVANAVFSSAAFQSRFMPAASLRDARDMLKDGLFDVDAFFRDFKSSDLTGDKCLQMGYLIREDKRDCAKDSCKSDLSLALIVRLMEGGVSKKDFAVGRKSQLGGFKEGDAEGFYSVHAFQQSDLMAKDLSKQLGSGK